MLASFGAECQVVVDRVAKRILQLGDRLPLKGDDVSRVDDFSMKQAGIIVELDFADIALESQHRMTRH